MNTIQPAGKGMLRRLHRFCGVPLSCLMVLACGDSTGTDLSAPRSITLIPSVAGLDAIGATVPLAATVRDALGNTLSGVTVEYRSSDAAVATVSGSGVVTAAGPGTATITAVADSLTRESMITVSQLPVSSRLISGLNQSALVGTALPSPFVVEVRDRRDNPIAGVTVSFALGLSPGSLSSPGGPTGADGRASTTMTLDTLAGPVYSVVATVTTGRADPVTFSATGLPDAAAVVAAQGGDQQRQPVSTALPNPIVVRVTDRYGNGVAGETVNFVVASGGGSVAPSAATSGPTGNATTVWTLGATAGAQTLNASVTGIGGAPLAFTATGTDLAVTSITPATLVEGGTATINGAGFDASFANNVVTVDGKPAVVTASTVNTIDFVVPKPACRPAQNLSVVVTTALGGSTPGTPHPSQPANPVTLAVGEQMIVKDPADFCLQFPAAAGDEHYLVGIQSMSSIGNSITNGRLIAETPPGVPAPPPAVFRGAPSVTGVGLTEREQRWAAHRRAETARQVWARERFRNGIRGPLRAPGQFSAAAIDSTVQVGQTVSVRMPTLTGSLCTDFENLPVVVKAVGTRGIWLHDAGNPPGFTDQDYLDLSATLDQSIYATDVAYFGQPTDMDGNNRILIVITKKINEQSNGVLGFVNPADLESVGTCAASNEAEVYYGRAPDATGALGGFPFPRAVALEEAPPLIAHEFAHIIQVGRRTVVNQAPFMRIYMAEGQAMIAEEVVGHSVTGNMPGQNYGYATAFNAPQVTPAFWYTAAMLDVTSYFGRDNSNPNTSVAGAPERCGWQIPDPSPCKGRALWYGVTWSWLRWISDHFGAGFTGGEQGIHRALIDNTRVGFDNIANVLGVSVDTLFAQWAAALYIDDRVPGAAARLTLPSWNLVDVIETRLSSSARLTPAPLGYGSQDVAFSVIAASAAYYRVQGANRPDVAFRAVGPTGAPLPSSMQVFVVRIQ